MNCKKNRANTITKNSDFLPYTCLHFNVLLSSHNMHCVTMVV